MNTRPRIDWKHDSNIDGAANASVIAAGIFVTMIAAGIAATGQAPPDAQLAQQMRANRTAVAAQTAPARIGGYGNSLRLAATAPDAAARLNSPTNKGVHHAQ